MTGFKVYLCVFALLLPLSATAKKDRCASIKPQQQLATEQQSAVEAMVKAGLIGVGRVEGAASTDKSATYDTQLLAQDDLAKAWYVYQLCVMKRDGVMSEALHESLMRELFGLEQELPPASAVPGVVGAAATQCPWGTEVSSAKARGRIVSVNGRAFSVRTDSEIQAFVGVLSDCRKGDAAMHFSRWRRRQAAVGTWAKTVIFAAYGAPVAGVLAGVSKAEMLATLRD